MDANTLRSLLQNLEREAQSAVAQDASFLEAVQFLKWEVDRDARVKAAMRALQYRGLSVSRSFTPRIRIRLLTGETMLALPKSGPGSNRPAGENLGCLRQIASELVTQQLRDAARAVVATSSSCRQLDRIVNEAVQANAIFERNAAVAERAGYEVQICLDLSTYAQVSEQSSTVAQLPRYQLSRDETRRPKALSSEEGAHLPLSSRDLQFLKQLRIRPD